MSIMVTSHLVLPAELSAFPVLVVDDEPDNLDAFRFNFKRVFQIHTAGSGDEALALLQRARRRGHRHRPAHAAR